MSITNISGPINCLSLCCAAQAEKLSRSPASQHPIGSFLVCGDRILSLPRSPAPILIPHPIGLYFSMSSSTTPSSSSASRFQFILDSALQDYTKQTGVDLTKYDFANQLELCGSPDEVLIVIRDKAKKFKEYRDGNRKLITWITPVVQFVHVFAVFLGEATSVVSEPHSSVQALRMTVFISNSPVPNSESRKSHFCWY